MENLRARVLLWILVAYIHGDLLQNGEENCVLNSQCKLSIGVWLLEITAPETRK